MKYLFLKVCALFIIRDFSSSVSAKADLKVDEKIESTSNAPSLAVSASASFPSSENLGVKIVNGQKTSVIVEFINGEDGPVTVARIAGDLSTTQVLSKANKSPKIITNLTVAPYDIVIPASESLKLPYSFVTDLHPQDLYLNIITLISNDKGAEYKVQAFNGTVTVVDPATSLFDPQILFLYTLLLSIASFTVYWIYVTRIKSLFPQNKRGPKIDHARRLNPNNQRSSVSEVEVSAKILDGTSSSGKNSEKTYDESWIPDHHLNKPVARRVKNSSVKKRSTE